MPLPLDRSHPPPRRDRERLKQRRLDRRGQSDPEQSMPRPLGRSLPSDRRDPGRLRQHRLDRWGRLDPEQSMPPPLDRSLPSDRRAQWDPLPWKQRPSHRWDRPAPLDPEQWMPLPSDQALLCVRADRADLRSWKQRRQDRPRPGSRVRPGARQFLEGRYRPRMTRPAPARDSWIRFPCCRKRLPKPVPAVQRTRRTLDSIAGFASTSEPPPSHPRSRTATPPKLKTSRPRRRTPGPLRWSTWLHPRAQQPPKPGPRRRWPLDPPTRPGWLRIQQKGLTRAVVPTGRTSQRSGWFRQPPRTGALRN